LDAKIKSSLFPSQYELRREKMSKKKDEGLSQTNKLDVPPMTLAEQVRGAKALAYLALEVARLIIEIIKLIITYRSVTSRPLPEITTD
jgi:hypothetical protein